MAQITLINKRSLNSREDKVIEYQKNKSPELLSQIVQDYTPLLHSIAHKYKTESYEDIVQTGYLGLINAVNRYQYKPNVKFLTYASWLIDGEIKHYLRDKVLIKEPRWAKALNGDINKAVAKLSALNGQLPTISEIAEEINVREEGIIEVLKIRAGLKIASLELFKDYPDDSSEDPRVEKIKSKRYETMHIPVEDRIILEQAMESLTEIQKRVIYYLFYKDLSQIEAAKLLGTTQRKISRILSKSLSSLREVLGKELW